MRHRAAHRGFLALTVPGITAMAVLALALILGAGLVLPGGSARAQGQQSVSELVRGAVEFYNERCENALFAPTSEQLKELERGSVVKIRRRVPVVEVESGEERFYERLTAYYLVPQPMVKVWLAALSPQFDAGGMLTDVRLRSDAHGNSRWYQYVALPWPVAARHYTIDVHKNPRLTEASGGRIWQHAWQLAENGEQIAHDTVAAGKAGTLTLESIKDAVYLPVNRGAWAMFELREDLTLIVYEVTASLGGRIPESFVNTVAMAKVDESMREVARIASRIEDLYREGASPIYSGEGYRIPWFGEEPPPYELKSRSVLPAASFRDGPVSGQFAESAHGVDLPLATQPVQGFSDLEPDPEDGFWVLSDNGYGTQANSADYVLVIYRLRPDFQNGGMELVQSIELSDPDRLAGFPLVADGERYPDSEIEVDPLIRELRLLTGADFDPEGLAAMPDGSFWVGDEFGPFLLHFDAEGRLLAPPVGVPGVWAPENRLHQGNPNHPSSGGFEGLCRSSDDQLLYALLEKSAEGDLEGQLRLYRFDPQAGAFLEDAPFRRYPLSVPSGHYVGAICALGGTRLAMVERDNLEGPAAEFKKVFVVDLDEHENGVLGKTELLDLLRIPDPAGRGAGVEGSRAEGSFAMPFITIEGIARLDDHTLLLCNDNNFPSSVGRHVVEGKPDDNEIILLHLR